MPDAIKEPVVYVFDGDSLLGTAFVIGVPWEGRPDHLWPYVITARHIVQGITDPRLRINDRQGGARTVRVDPRSLWLSEDSRADVAVGLWALSPDQFNLRVLPYSMVADEAFLNEQGVGPGDEVAFVGLFSGSPGVDRNLPIARFGQIARMNDELVASEGPGGLVSKLDVIMVEARSWGGHSGSPAFVLFSATRHPGVITLPGIPTSDTRAFWALLGLVSGHWELPVAVRERNAPKLPTPHSVAINAGIALVAPAQQIVDLLMRDDVVADRLAREQAHRDSEANLERLRSPMGGPTSRKRTKNRPVTFPHTD